MSRRLIFLTLTPVTLCVDGWVITVLWRWFVMPTFGLAPLAFVPAMGLSLFWAQMHPADIATIITNGETADALTVLLTGIGRALILLALGWAVHFFL